MVTLREWLHRLWGSVTRSRRDRELEAELRTHLELAEERERQRGSSIPEALRTTRLQSGGVAQAMEALRDQRGLPWLDDLMRDMRHGLRTLPRSPGFTAVALGTLALGIGATTAIFSVVHSVLLRPLPFPDADRLVMVWERQSTGRQNVTSMSNFRAWEESSHSFETMSAFHWSPMNLLGGDEPVQVTGAAVTADFFRVLSVPPILGRTFLRGEDAPNAAPVIVLSHAFWLQRFGGRADVIGRRISVNATHHEVIGVMPASFSSPISAFRRS
jgi:putative ABC transport system permease protein